MSMQDPISDAITRIRNAQAAKKASVRVRASNLIANILNVLRAEGFISDFTKVEISKNCFQFEVVLKYFEGCRVIEKIIRASKPSLRKYTSAAEAPSFFDGLGVTILTTPKGVMSDKEARRLNVGGEILCQVV